MPISGTIFENPTQKVPTSDPQIVRAMENLKLALRLRVGRGPLTEEQRRGLAEILDAAALSLERL